MSMVERIIIYLKKDGSVVDEKWSFKIVECSSSSKLDGDLALKQPQRKLDHSGSLSSSTKFLSPEVVHYASVGQLSVFFRNDS